jgi:hypothetical protein
MLNAHKIQMLQQMSVTEELLERRVKKKERMVDERNGEGGGRGLKCGSAGCRVGAYGGE